MISTDTKIKIYIDQEKTNMIVNSKLADHLIFTANELWPRHWQVIEYGEITIIRQPKDVE